MKGRKTCIKIREREKYCNLKDNFHSFKAMHPSLDHGHNPSDAH